MAFGVTSFRDIAPGFRHPDLIKHELGRSEAAILALTHNTTPADAQLGALSIRETFGMPDADIHYMPNGTSANLAAIAAMCVRSFDAVVAPSTGHVQNYEAGATESRGHKIITAPAPDAKLTPDSLDAALEFYEDGSSEKVRPTMVYLTQITELGTVYSKAELAAIVAHAKTRNLFVYLDGARLAMGIASESADISPAEFGQLGLDMFCIGGTKNGGVGEALVVNNDALKDDMSRYLLQNGALLKKPDLYDWQFERFFGEDELWLNLGRHANAMAGLLREGLQSNGFEILHPSDANHVFMCLSDDDATQLRERYDFSPWGKIDDVTTKVRLVCGWLTSQALVERFVDSTKDLKRVQTGL